jgi:AcrR family transcriptional regulator
MNATTVSPADQTANAGRPRDPRIDRAVLRATAELLVEGGYADLSIAAIAARAGTTKPAIYRRWRSLAHLVHETAFPTGETTTLPETGSLAGDLREMVRRTVAVFSHPVARAALPGLLAEVSADPSLHTALLERFQDGVWGAIGARVAEAVATGEARPGVDPGGLIETIGGATMLALLVRPGGELDDTWVEHTADLLVNGVTP